jgi:hypothetical protein
MFSASSHANKHCNAGQGDMVGEKGYLLLLQCFPKLTLSFHTQGNAFLKIIKTTEGQFEQILLTIIYVGVEI